MDQFGKIILGSYSYFRRRQDLPESVREELQDFVANTRWLIGVVGDSNGVDLISPEARARARPQEGTS